MTALFLEYQAQKDAKDNAQSMVGKLYYWNKGINGGEITFRKCNLLRVNSVYECKSIWNNKTILVVEYNYLDTGVPGDKELDYFLKYTKPYVEDSP